MGKKLSLNERQVREKMMRESHTRPPFSESEYYKSAYQIESEKKKKAESTNRELETKLAEIFFIHEFLKALTASVSVPEVTRLVVDGMSGILGTEISAVYLLNVGSQRLHLKAWHGINKKHLRHRIVLGEGIVGKAAARKKLMGVDGKYLASKQGKKETFMKGRLEVCSQIAAPLELKSEVLGVVAVTSGITRDLTGEEKGRLVNVANMSSLALQSAMFHDDLKKLSITDRLTELYDRGYFDKRLAEELDRARRYDRVLSLVMLDIDKFKDYNDTFGHIKGDILLRKIAKIIGKNVRSSDVVARYGGEEFVIILPETGIDGALIEAERVRRTIEETDFKENREHGVVNKTISAGVASCPEHAITGEKLVEKADKALYRAKRSGRNKVKVA